MEGNREVTRTVRCYSLEAVIAVGYRVNSERGTQFRQWAISILQQYIHKETIILIYKLNSMLLYGRLHKPKV
ncbi:MAG: virulence RhuM family protein [Candidatus Methanoperedens sp.]|nr:virulence RhuM family protein [Candidatus Methanoperedens sp.]